MIDLFKTPQFLHKTISNECSNDYIRFQNPRLGLELDSILKLNHQYLNNNKTKQKRRRRQAWRDKMHHHWPIKAGVNNL